MKIEDSPPQGFIPAEKDYSPVKLTHLPRPLKLNQANTLLSKQSNQNLEPDMMNGWRPKFRIVGPVPIRYNSQIMDSLISFLLGGSTSSQVVFIGPRPANSLQYHRMLIKNDPKYIPSKQLQRWQAGWQQLNSAIESISVKQPHPSRPFSGTVSTSPIKFDSSFESGNLDFGIHVHSSRREYDLIIRNDTNTRGHNSWFNFRVTSNRQETVTFNVINYRKPRLLFAKGMRPYVKWEGDEEWHPIKSKVHYTQKYLRSIPSQYKFHCLSFQLDMEQNRTAQLSYCVPYTYSMLKQKLKTLPQHLVTLQTLGTTLSGVDIPLITVGTGNQLVLVSGRVHPGQSDASFLVEGILDRLCSLTEEGQMLRSLYKFKIVPMLNPDGVIFGNFRTGLAGRDLNRCFHNPDPCLHPESKLLLQLAQRLKKKYGEDVKFFWDLHGHSTKTGFFSYGPDSSVSHQNYMKSRLFTKILQIFSDEYRPEASIFSIAGYKTKTARAILLKKLHIPIVFTFQASVGLDKYHQPLLPHQWIKMGGSLCSTLLKYSTLIHNYQTITLQHLAPIKKRRSSCIRKTSIRKYAEKSNVTQIERPTSEIKQYLEQIEQQDKLNHVPQVEEERGSDSQSQDQDLSTNQYNQLAHQIKANKLLFEKPLNTITPDQITKANIPLPPTCPTRQRFSRQKENIRTRNQEQPTLSERPSSARAVRRKSTTRDVGSKVMGIISASSAEQPVGRMRVREYQSNLLNNQKRLLAMKQFVFINK